MLVNQLLRQTAEQKVRGVVGDTLRERFSELTRGVSDGSAAAEGPDHSSGEATGLERRRIGVACLFALGIEGDGLVDLLKERTTHRHGALVEHEGLLRDRPIVVAESGVGAERAAQACRDLIALREPSWIISAGFAGALDAGLSRGDILMADSVSDQQGNSLDVGLKMTAEQIASMKGLHVGRLLTVGRVIRTRAEREQLAQKHGALACDMESAAVAEACRELKTRFLSVRIISDAVDERLPPEVERLLAQDTVAAKAGAAIGALFKRPSAVKDLWKLRDQAIAASDRLAKFLVGVIGQLDTDAE